MADKQVTYGQFIDLVEKTEIGEARIMIEEWKALATEEEEWKGYRPLPLTSDLVIGFAEDMANLFRQRLSGICTDTLYERITKDAHAFLVEISEKAKQLGIQVDIKQVNLPITITEVLIASGYTKIIEN